LDLQGLLLFIPVMLLSFTGHEYAHARVALSQGDDGPLLAGRVTWNPIKHIDPWMTVILPAALWFATKGQMVYGGAKPVMTNPSRYHNYRRGDILVSLAGVAMNLVLAAWCALAIPAIGFIGKLVPAFEGSAGVLQAMALMGVRLNLILVVFNLLPIPPLDGGHVVKHFLPDRLAVAFQRYGSVLFVALLLSTWVDSRPLRAVLSPAIGTANWVTASFRSSILPSTIRWLQ
jgi:Zn-dependent protease